MKSGSITLTFLMMGAIALPRAIALPQRGGRQVQRSGPYDHLSPLGQRAAKARDARRQFKAILNNNPQAKAIYKKEKTSAFEGTNNTSRLVKMAGIALLTGILTTAAGISSEPALLKVMVSASNLIPLLGGAILASERSHLVKQAQQNTLEHLSRGIEGTGSHSGK